MNVWRWVAAMITGAALCLVPAQAEEAVITVDEDEGVALIETDTTDTVVDEAGNVIHENYEDGVTTVYDAESGTTIHTDEAGNVVAEDEDGNVYVEDEEGNVMVHDAESGTTVVEDSEGNVEVHEP